jgi:beta-1,4-mannosyl-glycoprotein beta-1,4-N-acetylglucosaminyltransferase
MNIYDCFMYFDEDLLLDLRLHTLNKFVKKFVITEATYTHNGAKKKLNFDISKFSKYKEKITYIVVENEPQNILKISENDSDEKKGEKLILNGMARDYYQRENLHKGLKSANDNDLVLISDLDEIPNLKNLDFSKVNDKILIFEQKMFYYKFNLLYKNFKWFGTKGILKKNFISPQWLRNIKPKKYNWWRIDAILSNKKYTNLSIIENGGWHFTCIRSPEDLEKKMLNFAHHYEYENSGIKIDDLRRLIKEKKIMYKHNAGKDENKWSNGSTLEKIDNKNLPECIKNNLEKYKEWLD